jgi:transcription elongation factor Elf1
MAYGFPEPAVIPCPFCGHEILVLWVPETKRIKKATWGGSKGAIIKTRSEEYIAQQDCPNCKKTKEEIQKALNEEKK